MAIITNDPDKIAAMSRAELSRHYTAVSGQWFEQRERLAAKLATNLRTQVTGVQAERDHWRIRLEEC